MSAADRFAWLPARARGRRPATPPPAPPAAARRDLTALEARVAELELRVAELEAAAAPTAGTP